MTSYTIVLVRPLEQTWEPLGEIIVPKFTQRQRVRELVLEGQANDDRDTTIPRVTLEPGQYGELLIILTEDLGDPIPVRARAAVLLDLTSAFEVRTEAGTLEPAAPVSAQPTESAAAEEPS